MNQPSATRIDFRDSFVDARGCRQWLRSLPLTNVTRAAEAILGQLALLREAPIQALERARIVEALREPVMFLHRELARRYGGKPVPFAERERESARLAVDLWHGLWGQYSQCLKAMIDGDEQMRRSAGRLLQRALFAGKQQIIAHGMARRHLSPAFWRELHAFYRFAEILDSTQVAVPDSLLPDAEGVSCYSTYSHALLLALADPFALSLRELELVDRWLAMWARKAFPANAIPAGAPGVPLLVVDLEGTGGFAVIAEPPASPAGSMRFAQTAKLASSVGGRVKKLLEGESPASLKLGDDCATDTCVPLLKHLYARWCMAPRRLAADAVESGIELCGGGLPALYFRVTGQTLRREEPRERFTFQEAQRMATLDAVTGYDRNRGKAEMDWPWEKWQGVSGVIDATLTRAEAARHRWQLDQIAVCREANALRFARVTWVAEEPRETSSAQATTRVPGGTPAGARPSPAAREAASLDDAIADHAGTPGSAMAEARCALSLRLAYLRGEVRAALLQQTDDMLRKEPPFPAFYLLADGEAPSLIVPPRTFQPGRALQDTGSLAPPLRLTRLLQRGADYERVAFDAR